MNQSDLKTFMENNASRPPAELDGRVRSLIHGRLNPTILKTMAVVGLVHLLVAPLSLLFCPQFGFSLTHSMGLTHWFSQFGDEACTLACGGTYVIMSVIAASLLLS